MKSVTKSKITVEQVKLLAKKHFPGALVSGVKELTAGMFNAAYLVEGDRALEGGVVLKVGPTPDIKVLTYEKDIMRTEIDVYHMLAEKPIPTPKILAQDFSREDVLCDYFFMERLPGDTWKNLKKKIPKSQQGRLMEELGGCNAAVHSVSGEWFGYIKDDLAFRFDSWGKAFCSMVNNILEDGRRLGKKLPYEGINHVVQKNLGRLNAIKKPTLVDFDMWAGNVFLSYNDGYHISGVVDFERSFFGDPYADFVSAMMLFSDVEKEDEFCRGYGEISGQALVVTEDDRVRMDLYRLYLWIIMLVETYRFNKIYGGMVAGYCSRQIKALIKKLS